jgi:hypothetical protein
MVVALTSSLSWGTIGATIRSELPIPSRVPGQGTLANDRREVGQELRKCMAKIEPWR